MRKMSRRYNQTCWRCGKAWRAFKKNPARCRWCGSIYWNKSRVKDLEPQSPALEAGATELRTWDLKSNEQQVCQIHGIPLELGLAKIAYGLLAIDKTYSEDKRGLFPHSKTWVGGGCLASSIHVAQVDFCPQCREAEVVWHQMKKLLTTLEES